MRKQQKTILNTSILVLSILILVCLARSPESTSYSNNLTDNPYAGYLNDLPVICKRYEVSLVQEHHINSKMHLEDMHDENELSHIEVACDYYMYVNTSTLNIREKPTTQSNILDKVSYGDKLHIIKEVVDSEWVKTEDGFVHSNLLSEDKPTYSYSWDGPVLNKQNGRIQGPSGEETWYNDDMTFLIARLRRYGYDYEYWIREDGVKMYGQYVLVAANFDIRPIGTILETSLGTGIVCDTGGFVRTRPYGLDIAVTW